MKDIFSYNHTPEEVGISSDSVRKIYKKIRERKYMAHSLLIARNGKVFSEEYYEPFKKDEPHRMYSTSKSFAATAIGMLEGEGKLNINDKFIKYFPERIADCKDEFLLETTIRDLLIMSTPFKIGATYSFLRNDWLDSFFNTKTTRPSGTFFMYDTSASFILGVIAERVAGKPLMDYLCDNLISKIGGSKKLKCIKSPDGLPWMGSGVLCTTRDLARMGQIYLQKGEFEGEQLIPRQYAIDATSYQIDCNTGGWLLPAEGYGYGYQIWLCQKDCFAFKGMGGQFVIVSPKYNLLMAGTADVQGNSVGYNLMFDLFYDELLAPLEEENCESLPENKEAFASLKAEIEKRECPIPIVGEKSSPFEEEYLGKTYTFEENVMQFESLSINKKSDGIYCMKYFTRGEEKEITFKMGEYLIGTFPEKHYDGDLINQPIGREYRSMSAALWTEQRKLVIRTYIIDEYLGNMTTTLAFKGDTVTVRNSKTAEHFLDEYPGIAVGYLKK